MKYIPDIVLSNSSQKYLPIRNSIVHLYHQSTNSFLTATECRRKIAGDVAYIVRVHEFLDAFGVINYNPEIKVAFRNPKSAIFYSTCPSGASTSHKQLHKIEKESLKQSMWNDQLDTILMQAVTSALGSGNASFDDAAHEVGGINWQQVATAVASQVEEQKQMQFTSVACLVRFTEMSLGEAPGVASVKSVLPGKRADKIENDT